MSKGKKGNNYIDQIQEWQNHQYDPGYYTGGRIPHYLTNPGRPKLLALVFFFNAILAIPALIFLLVVGIDNLKYENTRGLISILVAVFYLLVWQLFI